MIKVKIKKEFIDEINEFIVNAGFDYIPFLFEEGKEYEVDESRNSLLISRFEREREFCIKGLDMKVVEYIELFNVPFIRRTRRVYFQEKLFKII